MSFHKILNLLKVQRDAEDVAHDGVYLNKDTRPLPPSRRTYGPWSFIGLWMVTGSFNIGGYTTGSSILSLGLNVWQAMLVVIIGHCLVALVCLGTGMPGAEWHIGFPILQRSTWGIRGSIFTLCLRILLSFVWCSVQLWWGGKCVKTFIGAIWPSFYRVNHPLADHKFFIVCSIAMIACVFALLGWAVNAAHGPGALVHNTSELVGVIPAKGSALGWAFVYGISSMLGGIAVHLFNQSDYTRFARRPKDQILSQALIVPLGTILNALIGIIVTSCAAQLYPTEGLLWQPYDLFTAIQNASGNSSRTRAAIAFASIAFILAQLGIAVVENALSGGIDLAGLLPRWFTLRRGGYFTIALAFVFQPWQLLNGASKFLTVIGTFSTFLSPMIAIMIADYFLVRHRKLSLTNLFTNSPHSIYWFNHGFHIRTFICWLIGVLPFTPGLAASVRVEDLHGWTKLYNMGFILGFVITFVLYYGSNLIFPIPYATIVDEEDVFGTFTERTDSQHEISFVGPDAEKNGQDEEDVKDVKDVQTTV
ncbi:hypothetical protein TREMEDRAFT_64403 [Tremella mesenterica DSM 1558]|uniref:uncharacterized protein n=1 Tax=Tremella mesenterica (strain ATCC 24925 / CBS 8224 / DSM 1558 / NBRC 9311 / NRRL Y-6157 / RJB 2259-6 / UBC 559-6) TaxID=578456 RepID=UPI0003F49EAA|nr:uncharacterized protein TREMEDRAFT_64403 [Tremella mesenterica DSM 1558]EIW67163.1 hypothetical protein TREMEDRAFT_64403 [Tremella mesenterica DSM 1558]